MTNETDAHERRSKTPGITSEVSLKPMDVSFDQAVIDDLHDRLRRTRRMKCRRTTIGRTASRRRGSPTSWRIGRPSMCLPLNAGSLRSHTCGPTSMAIPCTWSLPRVRGRTHCRCS